MSDAYTASDSMTGYLFQSRYALLRALQEAKSNAGLSISIERFDDVAFQQDAKPIELIQTKHHGAPANVSDKSVDVWKTLRVWMDLIETDPLIAANTRFVFLTTETAPAGSALRLLRHSPDTRDVQGAVEILRAAASGSNNQTTKAAREAFLALPATDRALLVSNIWVFDQAPDIHNVRLEIEKELFYSAPQGQVETFTDYLEGWWFARVVQALSGEADSAISLAAVQNKIHELRDDFTIFRLPLDPEIDDMPEVTSLPSDERPLVRQMRLIDLNEGEALSALHDYYRAFEQRSRWARESLLLDGEADRYDRALWDAWRRQFLSAASDLPMMCSTADKERAGKSVFRWARNYQKPLRNRDEIWLSSGSYQILADALRIGWHPEYEGLMASEESGS
ncbi:ABC-three component system protein [Hyphomonas atlantica corrig.]|uniref:ABC-three component system protein n=1 Tax=Hyphomonas atlantica TaxID=1280948 RepID=UPI002356450F|nr:ABC-three component system protein [Hyphomonas atlantica]